jgi:hypothetical protein
MYWIYLTLFIFVVLTPKVILEGFWFFREEDIEALVIFFFGLFGFVLYLIKEKALVQIFQEKMRLQKRTNIIAKDLTNSYSYIGGMNRKFDIMKNFIFHLPHDTAESLAKKRPETFRSIIESAKLLAKTDMVSLRFVNAKTKEMEKVLESGHGKEFVSFDARRLLSSQKTFWEENEYAIVRSPLQAKGIIAYIIFSKTSNAVEDADIFHILASQALLLFCIDRYGIAQEKENIASQQK